MNTHLFKAILVLLMIGDSIFLLIRIYENIYCTVLSLRTSVIPLITYAPRRCWGGGGEEKGVQIACTNVINGGPPIFLYHNLILT